MSLNTQIQSDASVTEPDSHWQAWKRALDNNPNLARALELQQQIKGVLTRIDFLYAEAEKLEDQFQQVKDRLTEEERRLL